MQAQAGFNKQDPITKPLHVWPAHMQYIFQVQGFP